MERRFIVIFLLSISHIANAQFHYEVSCKNETDILEPKLNAYYTASKHNGQASIDQPGDGWLRLTDLKMDQMGYVILKDSYSPKLGLMVEFDFLVYSEMNVPLADGFSVFLIDGNITPENFTPGGLGGALGYLPRDMEKGAKGAYLGIGIDEFGNFLPYAKQSFVMSPNNITLIGPESSNYEYIAHAITATESKTEYSIAYSHSTYNRPLPSSYYRRILIRMEPSVDGSSTLVTVAMKNSQNSPYKEFISNVNVNYPIPDKLRLGFSGVTGGHYAIHEVRNVVLKTSEAFSVFKKVNGDPCLKGNGEIEIQTILSNGRSFDIHGISAFDTISSNFAVEEINITGGSYDTKHIDTLSDNRIVITYSGISLSNYGEMLISYKGKLNPIYSDNNWIETSIGSNEKFTTVSKLFRNLEKVRVNNVEYCKGDQASILEINSNEELKVVWFDDKMQQLNQSPIPQTNEVGTKVYYVAPYSEELQCRGNETRLEVKIHSLPSFVNLPEIPLCCPGTNPILNLETNKGYTYFLYSDSNGKKLLDFFTGQERDTSINIGVKLVNDTTYYLSILDTLGCKSEKLTSISATIKHLYIKDTKLPFYKKNSDYTFQFETNVENPIFTLEKGELPEGLILDYSGKIYGNTGPDNKEEKKQLKIRVTDNEGCFVENDFILYGKIFLPQLFTPNNDGYNDIFMSGYKIKIFDRMGNTIFQGDDGWNGMSRGVISPSDIYFYLIYYRDENGIEKKIKGYVGLLNE